MLLSEHPAALAAPVSSSREGVSGPNCSQFRQQRRKTSLIAQALTARWSASLVFVWMANPI